MNVTALKQQKSDAPSDAPFQSAVKDLAANELIFAVVGPVGSGTSEIAEALEELLRESGYDATVLKAREVIEEAAGKLDIPIPQTPELIKSTALQNAGDQVRFASKDNAAVAVGLVNLIRNRRAERQGTEISLGAVIEPDGTRRAYILDSLRHPHEVALLRRVYQDAFCLIGIFCHEAERERRLREDKYRDASAVEIEEFMKRDEGAVRNVVGIHATRSPAT